MRRVDVFVRPFVLVSFRFKTKRTRQSNVVGISSLIFSSNVREAKELRSSLRFNIFWNSDRSTGASCTNNKKWMNGGEMRSQTWRVQSKRTSKHNATEQSDGQKCGQALPAQITKVSLSNNDNNAEQKEDWVCTKHLCYETYKMTFHHISLLG